MGKWRALLSIIINTIINRNTKSMKHALHRFLSYTLQLVVAVILFSLTSRTLLAQSPTGGYYYATSQKNVDDFIVNYPNCTELTLLYIGDNSGITNLNGFKNLTKIGNLNMAELQITSFEGFDKLQRVDYFSVLNLPKASLKGLESLTSVGNFGVSNMASLKNFEGLENLESIDGTGFQVNGCTQLESIDGLDCYFTSAEFKASIGYNYYVDSYFIAAAENSCNSKDPSTSVEDYVVEEIHFYPNPARNILYIEDDNNIKTVSIFDLSGKLLTTLSNKCSSINLQGINPGIYIVEFTLKNKSTIHSKLMIK